MRCTCLITFQYICSVIQIKVDIHQCNNGNDDWVYFDYSTSCDRAVQYTLLAGNTCVLTDGCGGNLYPAKSGWFSASDSTPPIPQVNGNALPYTITVTADNVGDTSAVVPFTPGAVDDCDMNPSFTVSHPSGSSFPVGSTDVTVTATDDKGKTATGTLTVTVIARTASPTNSPVRASILIRSSFDDDWNQTSNSDFLQT